MEKQRDMTKAVSIEKSLAGRPVLKGRTPHTPSEDMGPVFATLASTGKTGVFAGSFQGESAWERHRNGDELVQILSGNATVSVLTDEGRVDLEMSAGMVTIVPQACWHKFNAQDGVTVMTMTPQPTDHSTSDDPTRDE